MIMKLIAFAFLFTVTVMDTNRAWLPPPARVGNQLTVGRSDNGQSSLMAMLVGFLKPADVRHLNRDNEVGSYLHKVDSGDTAPATSIAPLLL